jgi:molecular chaperone DnaJ
VAVVILRVAIGTEQVNADARADLWHVETIAVPDAVLGTALEVPTLEGSTSVKVPAGTQPGSVLRLGGRGLPRFGGRGRGALSLYVDVHIPERLSAAERACYDQLRDLGRPRKVT